MKKELIQSIKEKELQLAQLKEHINKSSVCAELYNKVVLEKAILKKELQDSYKNPVVESLKTLIPRKKTLICDYFRSK